MKKLLGLLATAGLVTTATTSVVACGGDKDKEEEKNSSLEFSKIESKDITINLGTRNDKAIVKSVSNVNEKSILKVSFGEVAENGDVVVSVIPLKLPKDKDVKETLTITYNIEKEGKQEVLSSKKIDVTVKKDTASEIKEVSTKEVQNTLDAAVKDKEFANKQQAIDALKAVVLVEGLEIDGEPVASEKFEEITIDVKVKAKDGYKIKDGDKTDFSVKATIKEKIVEVSTSAVQAALDATTNGKDFENKDEAIATVKGAKLTEGLEIDGEPVASEKFEEITIDVKVKAKVGFEIKDGDKTDFSVKAKIKQKIVEVSTSAVQAALDATTSGKDFDDKDQAIAAVKGVKLTEGLVIDGEPKNKGETGEITIDVKVKAKVGYKIKDGDKTDFSVKAKIKQKIVEVSTSAVQAALDATTSGKDFDDKDQAIVAVKGAELAEGLVIDGEPVASEKFEEITIDVKVKAKVGFEIKDGDKTDFSVKATIKEKIVEVSTSSVQDALNSTTLGKKFDDKDQAIAAVKGAKLTEGLVIDGEPTTNDETGEITIDVKVKAKVGFEIKDGDKTDFSVKATIKEKIVEVSTSDVQDALNATTSEREFENKDEAIAAVKGVKLTEGLVIDGEPTTNDETGEITIDVKVKAKDGYKIKDGDKIEFSVIAKIKVA
ncbi:lipoprotein [Spiroplasma cantharicola]|uniref:Lipoprotein n=1 Tax=Spiroplasma cantharicola TaxID=362837 RepID=A0A0M5KLL7_9MOLU|nr:lipoprotein [Spiroplasma cantharicola]ALD66589.1 hypothetical protein SCANT_v1c06830 [Spiroplasma cantharicola]